MKNYTKSEKEKKILQMEHEKGLGVKFDDGKERYDLIAPWALNEIVKVYNYGAMKYDDNNWRHGMKWGKLFGALMRHAWKWWRGETWDPESGLHHLAHTAWQCLALMEYERCKIGEDDRAAKDLEVLNADSKKSLGK
jgi:hypothetical protein